MSDGGAAREETVGSSAGFCEQPAAQPLALLAVIAREPRDHRCSPLAVVERHGRHRADRALGGRLCLQSVSRIAGIPQV